MHLLNAQNIVLLSCINMTISRTIQGNLSKIRSPSLSLNFSKQGVIKENFGTHRAWVNINRTVLAHLRSNYIVSFIGKVLVYSDCFPGMGCAGVPPPRLPWYAPFPEQSAAPEWSVREHKDGDGHPPWPGRASVFTFPASSLPFPTPYLA